MSTERNGQMSRRYRHRLLVSETDELSTYSWEKDKPVHLEMAIVSEIRPTEIHVIPNGADDDTPTLLLVCETIAGTHVMAQIDFKTIWPSIETAIKGVRQ